MSFHWQACATLDGHGGFLEYTPDGCRRIPDLLAVCEVARCEPFIDRDIYCIQVALVTVQ